MPALRDTINAAAVLEARKDLCCAPKKSPAGGRAKVAPDAQVSARYLPRGATVRNNLPDKFGAMILALRQSGLGRTEIAARTGLSRSHLYRLRKGRSERAGPWTRSRDTTEKPSAGGPADAGRRSAREATNGNPTEDRQTLQAAGPAQIVHTSAIETSGRPVPVVSLGYLSVECPLNKIYGINCRPELGAKLLDRFFHRRRQVSPPVDHAAHRLFDGSPSKPRLQQGGVHPARGGPRIKDAHPRVGAVLWRDTLIDARRVPRVVRKRGPPRRATHASRISYVRSTCA